MLFIKTYQNYIIKSFVKYLLLTSVIFICLVFILNILEEIKFFQNLNTGVSYPILLTLLNTPSIIFEIFPFIFLLSTQMFFVNLYEKNELNNFKNFGLTNMKIIKVLVLTALICGFFLNTVFYTFSSKMKNNYLSFKNRFTDDNKYLAVVNENGLWIKDEIDQQINIINAEFFDRIKLEDITITQLDNEYDLEKTIIASEANIENKIWKLKNVEIYQINKNKEILQNLDFNTNFDRIKINNLFSNLSSLNFFQLKNLFSDYKSIGYSTTEIESYLNKLYSYPFYLMIMTIIGAILMFNVKYHKSKVINIIVGILFSVIVYYINYFFNLLGDNERIPIMMAIWLPLLVLLIICSIGIVTVNEK